MLADSCCNISLKLQLGHIPDEQLRASKGQAATLIGGMLHQTKLVVLRVRVAGDNVMLKTKQRSSMLRDAVCVVLEEVRGVGAMLKDDTDSIVIWVVDHR